MVGAATPGTGPPSNGTNGAVPTREVTTGAIPRAIVAGAVAAPAAHRGLRCGSSGIVVLVVIVRTWLVGGDMVG